jgi:Fe-S oxidoreductase
MRAFKKDKKKPIKDLNKEPAPILYFVGCTGAYNVPARVIPQATASIFQKLGLDFGVLGESELCCGSTAMRLGDVEAFKRIAEANLETFKKLHDEKGVQTIVTSCAGCYRAILKDYTQAEEYPDMMKGIRVIHSSQFLYELVQEGKLKLNREVPWTVTYHDPCHSGRHLNKFLVDKDGSQLWAGAYLSLNEEDCLYDQPRELLKAIPGIQLREMERIRANSYCCGGGGGVMTGYPDWAHRNAALRIQEGTETGAEHMVSICPFCYFNLNQGSQAIGSSMKLYDLTELLDKALTE